MSGKAGSLSSIRVAAKTGTLRGEAPLGINNWFVATAPADNPKVAIAVIVVDPERISTKASEIGRDILRFYFENLKLSQ